jgi:hypothetical protein
VPAESPGSGLTSVRYRDGSVCRIRSPRAIGGAKPCPLAGYVAPRAPRVSAAQVAAPVSARFAPTPVDPPTPGADAARVPAQWKLTTTFRARVPADAAATYVQVVQPTAGRDCRFQLSGPVARDVAAGEVVRVVSYLPLACRGRVAVTVRYVPPGRRPERDPFFAGTRGLTVGTASAEVPSRRP